MKTLVSTVLFLTFSINASAMPYTATRLYVWSKGETISGEEFIAANESVVDYIATLPRPTGTLLKSLKYECQIKSRYIRPDLNSIGSNPPVNGWVEIRTVYDIKECVPQD